MLLPSFARGRSRLVAPLFAALAVALAAPASAQEAKQTVAKVVPPPPETKPEAPPLVVAREAGLASSAVIQERPYRSGFVVGLSIGTGVASFAGYPNDSRKIGLLSHYTETGASIGGVGALWFGGALSEWFTFGIGFIGGSMPLLTDQKASAGGLIFHMEAYPLFSLRKRWRDLGVMFDAGTGSATVTPKDSDTKLIDSGSASMIGGGPFYEGFKLWKLKGGPFLVGNYMWSDSVRRPALFIGWRTSLYTGI